MKKIIVNINLVCISIALLLASSCKDFLKEEVYTEYDPATFLQTISGINSLLNAAYCDLDVTNGHLRTRVLAMSEFPCDLMWDWGGSFQSTAQLYMTWNWDPSAGEFSSTWGEYYNSIRNANALLDNIDNIKTLSEDVLKEYKAEAKFIRAVDYYCLWEFFGTVPLITSATEMNLEPVRATNEEFNTFITTELRAAANDLPLTQSSWGKATKGAALAYLGKFYMNTLQWQKAADVNKEVMDLNQYTLFSGDITNMFAVQNETNNEVIFSSPALPTLHGNDYMPGAFPVDYHMLSNWLKYGTQWCVYTNWVTTYNSSDKRLKWYVFSYTDVKGVFHNLLDPTDPAKAVRCFKYVPDPAAISQNHGNDVPMVRYAEVLLNRSEALNELNGPNQESVDLLNKIRTRAGVPTYSVSDFASKDAFRTAMLKERAWEFVIEGQRRMDLIRQGKLVSTAIARGATNAKDYMQLYPIPLSEISANPKLVQNPGYY